METTKVNFRRLFIAALAICAWASLAHAQSTILQAGPETAGHAPVYIGSGFPQAFVGDSGPAGGGGAGLGFTEMLLMARGSGAGPFSAVGTGPFNTNFCDYDGPTTGAYHYFCFSPNGQGAAGIIAFGFANGATALPLLFKYNGSSYAFPFTSGGALGPGSTTVGHIAIWNNNVGTLLADGGTLTFGSLGGSLACSQTPALTGNVTTPAGSCATTIGANVVTNAMLAVGAAAANVGTLTGDLAGSTLPATTIAAGAVTGAKIAANTVADSNIIANTISYASEKTAIAGTVVGNPTNSTANKQDMAMPSCSLASQFLQWVTGTGFTCGSVLVSLPTSPVRQTVTGGPVLLSGPPGGANFLPASSGSLSITSQNISASYPLVVTAANGYGAGGPVDLVGFTAANITWTGLPPSQTVFLFVTINPNGTLTPGSTTVAPTYEFGGTPSTSANTFTFNIAEMRGYMGNGATAPQAYVVFVGEVTTSGSTVTATVEYGYNGYFDSGYTNTLPGASAQVTASHNLGLTDVGIRMFFQNISAENGYSVGEVVNLDPIADNGGGLPLSDVMSVTRTAVQMSTGNNNAFMWIPKGGGNLTTPTAAKWAWRFVVRRNWGGA